MNLEARIAIEAMRAGVPNGAAVRLMGTDEPALEHAFDQQLHLVWADASHPRPGLGIAGGFGAGKSHFLGYLAEVARAQGFVVSRVVVSKETPLCDPARVFEAAVRAAALPDRHDDAITGALAILRQSRDKMAALELAVEQAGDALAPMFSALLFLLQRDTLPPGFNRRIERFLAGGKIRGPEVRQALAAVGGTRKFDLKSPPAAVLVEQRIHFLTAVFHATGHAGWCLLFDEVELIGRYTPLRRALAYAWLTTWLGLEGARAFPGIVAAYAITDDFVTAVIDERQDEARLTERLRVKDRVHEARLAATAMRHIAQTVRVNRLRLPGLAELTSASLRLSEIYRNAYDWEPPEPAAVERTATRTMRQYIKGWITEWDMRRLTGDVTRIVAEEIAANYAEDESFSMPSEAEDDEPG
ncbi:MAG: hypothetical protein EXR07_13100 [Acetobacteraceae bacterium]|nr:hypothetical protein [Acetobacteraceae bacterium]